MTEKASPSSIDCIADVSEARREARTSCVEIIGGEVVIQRSLMEGPSTQRSNTLILSAGIPPFTARAELERLLVSPPIYTKEQLEPAERAVGRMRSRVGAMENLSEVAQSLARDLDRVVD